MPVRINPAAGVVVTLAAFLITACATAGVQTPTATTESVSLMATLAPTATLGPPTPTLTPNPPTSTSTATITPSFTPTPAPPSPTTAPTATDTPISAPSSPAAAAQASVEPKISVSATTLTLPTYPIWDYLVEQTDPVYNLPVLYFKRPEFEAAAPAPTPVEYEAVVLENAYLRLTFLPQLGGRLYSVVFKSTGQELFYHNSVVKPSRYGGLQPPEANWWLATGGMEWAYPTQEHGYRWGVPWSYQVKQVDDRVTIVLSDSAPGRVGAEVEVTLPADSAAFTVRPKLTNGTAQTVPVQFWLNAALTLDAPSMSPYTRFIVPTDRVVVHSRGAEGWTVPDAHQTLPWPQVGRLDLSDYRDWATYLGFFAPSLKAPFVGAYNPETDLGVARLIEPGAVPGNKLFAFGPAFPDRSYTDNESQYFELWGGVNAGFWPEDDLALPAGDSVQWQESWWPLAGLGGLSWANQAAAIHLDDSVERPTLSLLVARPQQGNVTVLAGERAILSQSFSAEPTTPLRWELDLPEAPVRVKVVDSNNELLLDYCRDC